MNKTILFTEKQTAKFLGIEPTTLQMWRLSKKTFLPYIKVGRLVRYDYNEILKFLEKNTVNKPSFSDFEQYI